MTEHIISVLPFFKALLIIPIVTFITTYTISAFDKTQSYPYYFLSSSIDTKPSSSVGTFGIALTSMLIPIISTIRYEYVKHHITDSNNPNKNTIYKINKKGLKSSIISSVGALGVASFQDGIDKCGGTFNTHIIHLLFSVVFFSGGLFYGHCTYKLDTLLPCLGTSFTRFVRKCLWYCSIIQIILQPLNIGLFMSDTSDAFIFYMSILEIVLCVTIIAFYSTFYGEMKQLKLKIVLENSDFYSL